MIFAYDKVYVDKVQKNIGVMLEYAVFDLNMDLSDFVDVYIKSELARLQAAGDINALIGKSGVEMAWEVLGLGYNAEELIKPGSRDGLSDVYWTGWVLAYYQWKKNKDFSLIISEISINEIRGLYNPYHEMDIEHVMDRMSELAMSRRMVSYLKLFREKAGMSQSQLAAVTDIPLKTIQQYEQRRKDISKAQAEYVIKLSMALHCKPQDLFE